MKISNDCIKIFWDNKSELAHELDGRNCSHVKFEEIGGDFIIRII